MRTFGSFVFCLNLFGLFGNCIAQTSPGVNQVSRRELVRCSIQLAAGLSVNALAANGILKALNSINSVVFENPPFVKFYGDTYKNSDLGAWRGVRTAIETQLILIGKILLASLSKNGNFANASAVSSRQSNPTVEYLSASVVLPYIEEICFRLFPNALLGNDWVTGFISALMFAGMHNVTANGIDLKKIPLPAFIGGIYYWYLMRERGINHAIFAHMANNNAAIVADFLSSKFPVTAHLFEKDFYRQLARCSVAIATKFCPHLSAVRMMLMRMA